MPPVEGRELDVIAKDIEVLSGILNAHTQRRDLLRRSGHDDAALDAQVARYESLLSGLRSEHAEAIGRGFLDH